MRQTILSPDRKYRYTLWRQWDENGCGDGPPAYVMWIGLNPSTADETKDDPTIRRCKAFTTRFGFEAMCMTNLFAFRATDPRALKLADNPVGTANNRHLWLAAQGASLVIACWGAHGRFLNREEDVSRLLWAHSLKCLGVNSDGTPKHPLYLRADSELILWPT